LVARRVVGAAGFEPAASCSQSRRSARLIYAPIDSADSCVGRHTHVSVAAPPAEILPPSDLASPVSANGVLQDHERNTNPSRRRTRRGRRRVAAASAGQHSSVRGEFAHPVASGTLSRLEDRQARVAAPSRGKAMSAVKIKSARTPATPAEMSRRLSAESTGGIALSTI
jgi:hypothetical protein